MKKEYRKPAFSIRRLEDMTQEQREEYEAVIRQIKEEKKDGIPDIHMIEGDNEFEEEK